MSGALKQEVGVVGVAILGAGTAIGVSIFTVLQPAAEQAGSGLLVALVLAAMPMLLFALSYAYLGANAPVSGASYEWPRRYLHPFVGFAVAWLRIIGTTGAIVILAKVLVSYVTSVVPVPGPLLAIGSISVVVFLNFLGVSVAAWVQTAMMILLLIVFGFYAGAGTPQVDWTFLLPQSNSTLAILGAVPLMISLFLGIETAVEIGEEVKRPARTIPLGIGLGILLNI